jgi:exosome complex RNA-binding protein Csl4
MKAYPKIRRKAKIMKTKILGTYPSAIAGPESFGVIEAECGDCGSKFVCSYHNNEIAYKYCPYCGKLLDFTKEDGK